MRGALAAAGALIGGTALADILDLPSDGDEKRKVKRIGLQLYSLREAMKEDPEATLAAIAAMGYTELETAGYADGKLYGYEPEAFRKIVEDMGMKVSGAHLNFKYTPATEAEALAWWEKAFDAQVAVGCRYAIQPSMQIGPTLADLKAYCDFYNKLGEVANAKGLRFGFHNHAKEFELLEGKMVYDFLLENTDPAKVFFEMDVYWVQKGGCDPVEYLKKYAGRFPVLHIKDESIIGESGQIDFQPIFEAAYAQGMKDYYVEVEKYTLPAEICVQKSFDFLYAAPYVK